MSDSTDLNNLLAKYRKINAYFDKQFPQLTKEYKILARLSKITEELGELNDAVHGELGIHRADKQALYKREQLEAEWADVFNTVMLFGMCMDIDIPKTLEKRLQEISARLKLD